MQDGEALRGRVSTGDVAMAQVGVQEVREDEEDREGN